jgi:DNA-binding response OmpR family regulator
LVPVRILVLDDQESIVTMLARVCLADGHAVEAFTSSPAALIHLATAPIDLLITDMRMPEADGVTVVREARRLQPEVFTLVITGHAAEYPLAEIVQAGRADVMFKPFHMNELRARLALAEQRMRLIDRLQRAHDDLHEASRLMISGLERELVGAQVKGAPR